jgi:hypothetical protein
MAIKVCGRYYGGLIYYPNGHREYGPELSDVRDDERHELMDCKYCYRDDVQPLSSYEDCPGIGPEVQALCPFCAAGLTPPSPY